MRKKIGILLVCLMLVTVSYLVVSAKPPQQPGNYLKLPPIAQPNTPGDGFIIYCDSADGNLKALDKYGEATIIAVSQPPLPPYLPSNPYPANGATNIPINLTLSWTGGDPNGDLVTYDVFFGTTNPPSKVVSNQSATNYNPGTLAHETLYFWKIIAWDDSNAISEGPVWNFTTQSSINFKAGIYNVDSSGRAVGFVELGNYGLPDHYILKVKDLDTGENLSEFSKTGAVSNWIQITNISSSPIHYYPNFMDMYALFGNPNWVGTYLGIGVMNSPWEIKYISNTPITRDNFIVNIKPWTGYSAGGSQSRGLYFDYVDMNHTYLVRINGDSSYILEDLSTNTVLASGSFSGDNNNPNMDIFLEVSDMTDTTMHVKTYTQISPAPYERLFFEGNLPRQG